MAEKINYTKGDKIGSCFYVSENSFCSLGKTYHRNAQFLCSCGNFFVCAINEIRNGKTSCGCKNKTWKRNGETFARKKTPEYISWRNIKNRCTNTGSSDYKYYGARGITICERWKNSFKLFLFDMGKKPSPKLSVERINNDLGYSPQNCKWGTYQEQSINKTISIYVELNGEKISLRDAAMKMGIKYHTLLYRVRHGKRKNIFREIQKH